MKGSITAAAATGDQPHMRHITRKVSEAVSSIVPVTAMP